MKFQFTVGTEEQHCVEFAFDQFIGNLEINVDGDTVVSDFRTFSRKRTKRYEFELGQVEKHHVAIEKERKLLLAGLRKQKYRVFVDGELIKTY